MIETPQVDWLALAPSLALLAATGAGMMFFVTASNLMTLFLGLEWFSIALYILCALDTHRETSLEAGLKYLVVGSVGSATLLYGLAFIYGGSGSIGFKPISTLAIEFNAEGGTFAAGSASGFNYFVIGPRVLFRF